MRVIGTILFALLASTPMLAQAPSAARTSLIETEHAMGKAVFQRGLLPGIQDILAEDAVLLMEGAPLVQGRARVIQMIASQPIVGRLRIQRVPVVIALSDDGLYGASTGVNVMTRVGQAPDSAGALGHYLIVWRRTGDSAPWRIVVLLENGVMGEEKLQSPAALGPGPVPPITGSARTMAEADLAFAKMASDSGVHAAFGNYAAPDATFPPGESDMAIGAAAIRARMATPARMQSDWSWRPVFAGATASGDFGYTVGEATIRSSRSADAAVYEGKYLTVWRRQPDGSVKFIFDSGNARQ